MIVDATDEDFTAEVIDAEGLVFVDFWGPDCESCEYVEPFFNRLAKEYGGQVKFVKVFADDAPDAHAQFDVESYPRLMLFKDGEHLDECVGEDDSVPDLETLRDFLAGHIAEYEGAADEDDSEDEDEEEEEETSVAEADAEEASEDEDADEEEEDEEEEEDGPGLLSGAAGLIGALFGGGDDEDDKKKRKRDDEDE